MNEVLTKIDDMMLSGASNKLVPEEVDGATLEKAAEHDRRQEWAEAANQYFTLYNNAPTSSYEKANAGIWLAQIFINADCYDEAETVLKEVETDLPKDPVENARTLSTVLERRAWIADYRKDYDLQINLLQRSLDLAETLPEESVTNEDRHRKATRQHFMARALTLKNKALSEGGNIEELDQAYELFGSALAVEAEIENPAAEAFGSAWLARVDIRRGNIESAEHHTQDALEKFEIASDSTHNKKILSAGNIIQAELALTKGESDLVISSAKTAIENNLEEDVWELVEPIIDEYEASLADNGKVALKKLDEISNKLPQGSYHRTIFIALRLMAEATNN